MEIIAKIGEITGKDISYLSTPKIMEMIVREKPEKQVFLYPLFGQLIKCAQKTVKREVRNTEKITKSAERKPTDLEKGLIRLCRKYSIPFSELISLTFTYPIWRQEAMQKIVERPKKAKATAI